MSDSYKTVGSLQTITDPDTPELVSGLKLLERYRLEKEAGKGNMGVVWKAWDEIGERWVALKFVLRESRSSNDSTGQLKKAFDTIKALNHQNIGQIYSIEKDPLFGYFVVIKWLDGKPLSKTEIPREQIPFVLTQVADALDYAHKKGVIHRDVKPSNIFIENDFETFLIDFGIAAGIQNSILQDAISDVCLTSGTRQYMAPEQWRGQPQDGRTDQYALAAVAYQLYAGRLPFENSDVGLLRMAILQDSPEPIKNVPSAVNSAIQRALSKERENRFATCREFIDALTGKGKTRQWSIPSVKFRVSPKWRKLPPAVWNRMKKLFANRKWQAAIGILILVGLVLLFCSMPSSRTAPNPSGPPHASGPSHSSRPSRASGTSRSSSSYRSTGRTQEIQRKPKRRAETIEVIPPAPTGSEYEVIPPAPTGDKYEGSPWKIEESFPLAPSKEKTSFELEEGSRGQKQWKGDNSATIQP